MLGDSAGLIHPLCGNGMAMAIHSAKLLSEIFIQNKKKGLSRKAIEDTYAMQWQEAFSRRLRVGKLIQGLLLKPTVTGIGFTIAKAIPGIVPMLIKQTHGELLV
jgi:flavin-dependent dehydrogenase